MEIKISSPKKLKKTQKTPNYTNYNIFISNFFMILKTSNLYLYDIFIPNFFYDIKNPKFVLMWHIYFKFIFYNTKYSWIFTLIQEKVLDK